MITLNNLIIGSSTTMIAVCMSWLTGQDRSPTSLALGGATALWGYGAANRSGELCLASIVVVMWLTQRIIRQRERTSTEPSVAASKPRSDARR
jgi:hypothetical protein